MEQIIASLITATVPAVFALRAAKHAKEARATAAVVAEAGEETRVIVSGNGHGNVSTMLEVTLDQLRVIASKVDSSLEWQGRHEAQHTRTLAAATSAYAAVELLTPDT